MTPAQAHQLFHELKKLTPEEVQARCALLSLSEKLALLLAGAEQLGTLVEEWTANLEGEQDSWLATDDVSREATRALLERLRSPAPDAGQS